MPSPKIAITTRKRPEPKDLYCIFKTNTKILTMTGKIDEYLGKRKVEELI